MPRHFISYSSADAEEFALRLRDELEAGHPSVPVWVYLRDMHPGQAWDQSIAEALKTCAGLLFIMTRDSVEEESPCKGEWTYALRYKKPVVPIALHADAEMPFRLAPRQHIDFAHALESEEEFNAALARLRRHLEWLASPAGALQSLKDRLADAQRDLRRTGDTMQQSRIRDEIEQLKKDVARQEQVVRDPGAAERRVEESIARGLERERQSERPIGDLRSNKFINTPPGIAPAYFQDRHVETGMLGGFLKDEALRMLTIIGRGGTGKTALICRLLKSLESGRLPDGGGPLATDGIVYLSAMGTRRITTQNLYADLCKLLPAAAANQLDALYRDPLASTETKMRELLSHFTHGRNVVLLDNFEDVIDDKTHIIGDKELSEALRALLNLPHHTVKVVMTTLIAPQDLAVVQPGRQRLLHLDEGLSSPYAENILREMDADGKVGLRDAPDHLLNEARERTRGYPRALEALFAILAADRDTTLPEILKDTAHLLPDNVIRDLVGEAFNRLDLAAQWVMKALAVYDHPVTPAAVDYLLQPHLSGVDSAPVLKRLVNMKFARRENGRYFLHPVDSAYTLSRISRGERADRGEGQMPRNTQFALRHRAAEYFKQSRLSRDAWKTIEDLAPQLAEFDLRCDGEGYDTAASVLLEIYIDLFTWGFYHLLAKMHERLKGHLGGPRLEEMNVGQLGTAYFSLGQLQKAAASYEQALELTRANQNRQGEGIWLGKLGDCHFESGQIERAIDYYKESLDIARETSDRREEGVQVGGLGNCFALLGELGRAGDSYKQSLAILREVGDRFSEGCILSGLVDLLIDERHYPAAIRSAHDGLRIAAEVNSPRLCSFGYGSLALAHFYLGELAEARAAVEEAQMHDEPSNNHYVSALLGLINIKQGDKRAALDAFTCAVTQAETMLTHSVQNFSALDSKGLALCGVSVCEDAGRVQEAVEAYRAARAINKDAGTVARVLRLFDALAETDAAGVLAGARAAAAGEE